jgi:hypothetical protein
MHTQDGRWSVEDLLKTQAPQTPRKPPAEVPRSGRVPLLGGLLLSEVAVRNGEITLLDQTRPGGSTLTLSDLDFSLRQASASDPIEVRSQARIEGTGGGRIETDGRISAGDADGPVVDLTFALRDVEVGSWQAFLLGRSSGTKLSGPVSAEVKVTGPIGRAAFTGSVNLKPVVIQAGEMLRKAAGEEARLSFQGRREDLGVNLAKVTVTLKDVTVDGSLRVPDLKSPRITFTAASATVDLDRLLAQPPSKLSWAVGPPMPHESTPHPRPLPQRRRGGFFEWSAWFAPGVAWAAPPPPGAGSRAAGPGLTAQGRVSIGDLRYQGLVWTAIEAEIRYHDGLVQLPEVRANFMNGKVTTRGEVDLRPKTPRIALTSRLDRVATEPLVKALAPGAWTLRSALSFESSVSFVGFARPEILGSAAGGGSLLLEDGRLLDYRPLDRLSEVIAPILASQGVRVRLNEFEQVTAHYTLDKGVLRTKDLTLTKAEGTLTAVGSLGLLDSSLNFDVVAKLGRTTVEAKVTGTTSQPIVVPKLGRLQRRLETELDKVLPGEQGKSLKDLFKGLFGR